MFKEEFGVLSPSALYLVSRFNSVYEEPSVTNDQKSYRMIFSTCYSTMDVTDHKCSSVILPLFISTNGDDWLRRLPFAKYKLMSSWPLFRLSLLSL